MSLVSVLGIPPPRCGAPPWSTCLRPFPGRAGLSQHPLHALLLKISLNAQVCVLLVLVETPVSGGHSDSDTQDRVRQQPVSAARGGAGTACISTQRVENRRAGCGPPCISPALLSLTSSLLTSMFHTAIPPSEEQETSCLRELQVTQRLHSVCKHTEVTASSWETHALSSCRPSVSPRCNQQLAFYH